MANPSVEAFVINYQGGRFLHRTLVSLLARRTPDVKVILSDNGSTDGSVEAAEQEFGDRIEVRRRVPPTGRCYAHYNACIREVRAPFFAIYHNDDTYGAGMVEDQRALLAAHADVGAVFASAMGVDEAGQPMWPILPPSGVLGEALAIPSGRRAHRLDRQRTFEAVVGNGNSFLVCPSVMFRTEAVQAAGPFAEQHEIVADAEDWLRLLALRVPLAILPEPRMNYRITTAQGSAAYERDRIEPSEFFAVALSHFAAFEVSAEVRERFNSIRRLDALQAAWNACARGGSATAFKTALRTARVPDSRWGAIDRLRMGGLRALAPWSDVRAGRSLARAWWRVTDPRGSKLLRHALRLKRAGAASP